MDFWTVVLRQSDNYLSLHSRPGYKKIYTLKKASSIRDRAKEIYEYGSKLGKTIKHLKGANRTNLSNNPRVHCKSLPNISRMPL